MGLAATGRIANSRVLATPDVVAVNGRKNGKKNRVNPTLTRPDPVLPPISADPTRPVFSGLSFLAAPTRPRAEILISKLGVRGLVIKPRAARGMALIKNFRAARESLL